MTSTRTSKRSAKRSAKRTAKRSTGNPSVRTAPPAPSAPLTIGDRFRQKLSDLVWPLVWMGILTIAGGISLRAVSIMTANPPLPDCTELSATSSDPERLLCAQASVRSGSGQALIEAIELVAPWPTSNPQYEEANRLMNRWSKALLSELELMVQRGDVQQAKELAKRIPERVDIYPEVKSAIATWDKEWSTGKEFEAEILQALQVQNWTGARQELQSFKSLNSNYWVRTRYQQLKEKIDREETARRQLNEARSLAKTNSPQQLGKALAIAEEINLETAAWKDSKPDVNLWAQKVLQYSFQKWEQEDIEAAIAIVQFVPPDLALTAEAKDLVSFGHAKRLATSPYDQWTPSYAQIYSLLEAIQAIQQISPTSPFYAQAQESLSEWKQKLDDLVQLQYASTLAKVGQRGSYLMAIAEAEKITQERPQRLQAQTLVSHWQKEIQRQEDRPILSRAVQLAIAGGKANLQLAIAEANKVAKGRALRVEGQTYIAEWADRIEIIEDQPLLTKAQKLATGSGLTALRSAIAEAQKVAKGRALYDQAQTKIKDWTAEIQTAEDRPILTQAEGLAANGSLTAAIDTAAQIAPGRSLYGEARSSIAIWARDRAYIWSLEAPAEDDAVGGYQEDGAIDDSATDPADNEGSADSYNDDYNQ